MKLVVIYFGCYEIQRSALDDDMKMGQAEKDDVSVKGLMRVGAYPPFFISICADYGGTAG